jgi:hypothetical protein
MSDGAHFGAEGDWTEEKSKRLAKGLTDIVSICVKDKDTKIKDLQAEIERLTTMEMERSKHLERLLMEFVPVGEDCGTALEQIEGALRRLSLNLKKDGTRSR